MDVKIDILKKVEEVDAGRAHVGYKDYYNSVWATPTDLYGSEIYDALNVKLENTIAFEVRYCQKIKRMQTHCKDFYIRYEGDLYDVYHVSLKRNEKIKAIIKANRID